MQVYQHEIQDGLTKAIGGNTSIAFVCDIIPDDNKIQQLINKSIANRS